MFCFFPQACLLPSIWLAAILDVDSVDRLFC